MMSRTVRYFKLVYIVAGILLSNEDICETVDQIHIAPRVDMKDKILQLNQKKNKQLAIEGNQKQEPRKTWIKRLSPFNMMDRVKRRLTPAWSSLSLWTIPNIFIEFSTNLFCRKFVLNSDCDMIYK